MYQLKNNFYSKKAKKKENEIDKFLCYCSQVSHNLFKNSLIKNPNYNVNDICNEHNIGKKCSACLPNVEEYYLKIRGDSKSDFKALTKNTSISVKKRILTVLDFLSGNTTIVQKGFIPIINANFVKTWLMLSNFYPLNLANKSVPYQIYIDLYDSSGNKVNTLIKKVLPGTNFKLCFQDLIKTSGNKIETYFAKVIRKGIKKGFRGSIRPHFYYQSKHSMAAVHSQDGNAKKVLLDFYSSRNNDNYFLFIINPNKKEAFFHLDLFFIKKKSRDKVFESSVNGMGSKLIKINDYFKDVQEGLVQCKSNINLKHYLVISDKKYEKFSADHL